MNGKANIVEQVQPNQEPRSHPLNPPSHWKAGNYIVYREVWQGKIWTARSVIVVQDEPDLNAMEATGRRQSAVFRLPTNRRMDAG